MSRRRRRGRYTRLGEKAWDIPHLVESLCAGDLSFDKVRAVADVATPETDRQLRDQAKECSVRQLADIARSTAAGRPSLGHAPSTTVASCASTSSSAP